MKKTLILLLLLMIFAYGCKKEQALSAEPEITGLSYEIDEIISEEPEENITTVRLCHDTDNGIVRWLNGTIFGFHDSATRFELKDFCFDQNLLIEYYCENETPQNRSFICKNGCLENHCL